jgi:shikimate kinase
MFQIAFSSWRQQQVRGEDGGPSYTKVVMNSDLLGLLSKQSADVAGPRRIVLTGFMGSGKSTVGPLVARRLGWSFVDVDEAIEAEAGVTITELFARNGEAAFRERERAAIARLAERDALVMALGGGAIEHEGTRTLLLSDSATLLVHLEVELATTLRRCQGTEQVRPVLADHANLAARYERRLPLYRQAHFSLVVDTLVPEQVVDAIVNAAAAGCGKVNRE